MKVVAFDAETVPSHPVADGQFPALHLHLPVALCWLESEPFKVVARYGKPTEGWELEAMQDFRTSCVSSQRLVTFNGRGFDMPLLNIRAAALGVDWSWWMSRRHRYENFKTQLYHYDIQEMVGDQGAARNFGLSGLAKALGLPGKAVLDDGSKVAEFIAAGKEEEVAWYCVNDVILTWLVYLRLCISQFGAKQAEVKAKWDETLAWVAKQERLAETYKGVRF